jgi:hypothetical protein
MKNKENEVYTTSDNAVPDKATSDSEDDFMFVLIVLSILVISALSIILYGICNTSIL